MDPQVSKLDTAGLFAGAVDSCTEARLRQRRAEAGAAKRRHSVVGAWDPCGVVFLLFSFFIYIYIVLLLC